MKTNPFALFVIALFVIALLSAHDPASAEKAIDRTGLFLNEMKNFSTPLAPVISGGKVRYCLPLSFDGLLADYRTDKASVTSKLKAYCSLRPEHWHLIALAELFSEKEFDRVLIKGDAKLAFFYIKK